MVRNSDLLKANRVKVGVNLLNEQPYLQLLTFTLSALSPLSRIESYPLLNHIEPLLGSEIDIELTKYGVFKGRPRSGNQACFLQSCFCMLLYKVLILKNVFRNGNVFI